MHCKLTPTQKGLDEIWQRERDLMSYAFASAVNAETRRVELLKAELSADEAWIGAYSSALGNFAGAVVNGIFGYYGTKSKNSVRSFNIMTVDYLAGLNRSRQNYIDSRTGQDTGISLSGLGAPTSTKSYGVYGRKYG